MFDCFRKAKKEPRKDIYLVAYACDDKHCQRDHNDGICQDCGGPVRKAVCKGRILEMLRVRLPYGNGFVRWMDPETVEDQGNG